MKQPPFDRQPPMPRIIIIAINAGSSSLKLSVFDANNEDSDDPRRLADAEVSGLSAPPASLKYTRGEHKIKGQELSDVHDQQGAFDYVLDHLFNDKDLPELKGKDDISYVTHRIVHGGAFDRVHVIDQATFHTLQELSDLAPLHNGVGLAIVKTVHEKLPHATNMAYFDSAFHTTMPRHVKTYAIDQKIAERNQLRKYGFHGISYSFITKTVAKYLEKPVDRTNIIALHLGSGASACAIKDGKSYDTTMGLTPLSGLPGGSRSGDIDPSLMFHYTHDAGKPSQSSTKDLHITQAEEILNKKSGFKALTGTSDFGKILASDDEMCKLTVDLFIDRIVGYIGSYYVKLGGKVDALVFAGGIGEKAAEFRRRVIEAVNCLGFIIDEKKNVMPNDEWWDTVMDFGAAFSKHRVLVCETDEQFEMARGCIQEAENLKKNSSE